MDQAAGKQQVLDELLEVKVEMNRMDNDATRACQELERRVVAFERAGAWTDKEMTEEFGKWQAMHRQSVQTATEGRFIEVE